MKKTFFSALFAALVSLPASAATLYYDNLATITGIVTSTNAPLAGGILRYGWFPTGTDFSDTVTNLNTVFRDIFSIPLTGNTWNTLGTYTSSGSYNGTPYDITPGDTSPPGNGDIAGEDIYLWILDNATIGSATQHGIFSVPGVFTWADANPVVGQVESFFSTSLTAGDGVVAHVGIANPTNPGDHKLAAIGAVPEPGRAVLMLAGLAGMLFRRRRA
jgi:hypothetical protein